MTDETLSTGQVSTAQPSPAAPSPSPEVSLEHRVAALEQTVLALSVHSITGVPSEDREAVPKMMKSLHDWTDWMLKKFYPSKAPAAPAPAGSNSPASTASSAAPKA